MHARESASPPFAADVIRNWLASIFTIDARALAAFRIGLGCLLLGNLWDLLGDVGAFYTDGGILSRADRTLFNFLEESTAPPYWVSLHMLSGEAWFQYLLFATAAGLAVCVLLGYRTSAALFGSWVLLTGLQARNPMPLHAGDDVLRCMLFWSLFLPLDGTWSCDRRRTATRPAARVCSLATAALLIQLYCIYCFTAILKSHAVWRSDFTATYYALAMDHMTLSWGRAMLAYPALLKAITVGTLALEIAGPLLLLGPWQRPWLRTGLAAVFCAFHLGIAATLNIGLFPLTCIVCWLIVLPSEFWNGIAALCRRTRLGLFQRSESPTESGNGKVRPAPPSRRPADSPAANSFMSEMLVAALLSGVVLLNCVRLNNNLGSHLQPRPLRLLVEAAQLNQLWCMFAPRPHDSGGWYNVNGTLADGRRVNLLRPDQPPQTERPPLVCATYPNPRWCKLMMNLVKRDCPIYRRGVGAYLCRHWNATHGPAEQLVAAEIALIQEPIFLPGEPRDPARKPGELVLWRWRAPADLSQSIAQAMPDAAAGR